MIKKYILLVLLYTTFYQTTHAQWSAGASTSYLNLLVKDGYSNWGFSVKAEKNLMYFGFGYNAKVSGKRSVLTDTAVFGDGQVLALSTYSIKSYNIFLGVKNYFIGDYDHDNWGLYGLVDISYYYLPLTKRIDGPINEARYYRHILYGISKEIGTEFEEFKTSEILLTGGVGLGLEKKIKSIYLYGDALIKMSVTGISNSPAGDGASSIFLPLSLNFGLRVPLDY